MVAALLHDTIEDTNLTKLEIEQVFGKRVLDLVMEVTHDGKADAYGYYFPRLKTADGMLIKFCDRASNLSRMTAWTKERQLQYMRKSKFWKDGSDREGLF